MTDEKRLRESRLILCERIGAFVLALLLYCLVKACGVILD